MLALKLARRAVQNNKKNDMKSNLQWKVRNGAAVVSCAQARTVRLLYSLVPGSALPGIKGQHLVDPVLFGLGRNYDRNGHLPGSDRLAFDRHKRLLRAKKSQGSMAWLQHNIVLNRVAAQ